MARPLDWFLPPDDEPDAGHEPVVHDLGTALREDVQRRYMTILENENRILMRIAGETRIEIDRLQAILQDRKDAV